MWDIIIVTLIMIGVAVLGVVLIAAFVWWKVLRSDERKLARRIGKLNARDKLRLGRDLFGDSRVPIWARFVAIALVVYLASPIDILPDFIPGIGLIDDLLIVMIGAGLLLRSVPRHVIEEHVSAYEQRPPGIEPRPTTQGR
jgi:uncharacterized membrane protein YkvA (DUF1232 family)